MIHIYPSMTGGRWVSPVRLVINTNLLHMPAAQEDDESWLTRVSSVNETLGIRNRQLQL